MKFAMFSNKVFFKSQKLHENYNIVIKKPKNKPSNIYTY